MDDIRGRASSAEGTAGTKAWRLTATARRLMAGAKMRETRGEMRGEGGGYRG